MLKALTGSSLVKTSTSSPLTRYFGHLSKSKTKTLGKSHGRVIILGSGWAGYQLLRKLNKKDYEVTVVSPRNHFVFTPLLASTAVGTLEFRGIVEPVRGYSKDIDYHQAWVDGVDLKRQVIRCTSNLEDNKGQEFELDYDKLVISVGAYANTFNTPGVKEHGIFLKDISDAKKIRNRVLECFEYAAQPGVSDQEKAAKLHFAIIGGGATGVEFSSELYDFISEDLSRLYPQLMDHTRMTVYDVAPSILNTFDSKLADYATKKFTRRGIQIKTGTHVVRVEKDYVELKEEGKVPYGMLIWSTGLSANPLVESLKDIAKDERSHRILTNEHLQVLDDEKKEPYSNVYALGDCATILNQDLPATAQVANQKAIYLSKTLNNEVKGKPTDQGFSFKNMGSMAYIGSWKAVVDMSAVHEGATEGGFLAWLFWRSAYLSMTVSARNKMLIPMYWFSAFLFGRDVSKL
ncbi:FAD/NAD-P-binding domain-containing protein [Halteromyces radiatus]|uniref:FAD/NAD-P-binding domain-containing protein n=1 Tax=Halteromyces radiatus TaxID=101107 RepID=UPI00221F12E0|nr:FAD/NAD-P-binding domain-containing protein [Halteromyces radiatus]KAI8088961.1 FAD/NAD-P-binding domain-containing protein [Halteromyces radiatus]